jgi:hypothetical protein
MIADIAIRRLRRPGAFARAVLVAASIALAAAHPAGAQTVTATSGDPGVIARIRAQFAEIEHEAPTYRRTTHNVWDFSLEGGELEGFYRGSELRKLKATLYGETWRGTEEYYFSGDRPVFIYVVTERYDRPFTMKFRIRLRIEDRYYFDGGRLIRHVHARHPASEEWDAGMSIDEQATELLKTAGLFAACAAATGAEPPECTAPARDPQKP